MANQDKWLYASRFDTVLLILALFLGGFVIGLLFGLDIGGAL